jgi:hypothetical protein
MGVSGLLLVFTAVCFDVARVVAVHLVCVHVAPGEVTVVVVDCGVCLCGSLIGTQSVLAAPNCCGGVLVPLCPITTKQCCRCAVLSVQCWGCFVNVACQVPCEGECVWHVFCMVVCCLGCGVTPACGYLGLSVE